MIGDRAERRHERDDYIGNKRIAYAFTIVRDSHNVAADVLVSAQVARDTAGKSSRYTGDEEWHAQQLALREGASFLDKWLREQDRRAARKPMRLLMNEQAQATIVRTVRPDLGVTIETWLENDAVMAFRVREHVDLPDGRADWTPTYEQSEPDGETTDFYLAARYVDGFIKWDSCAHFNFGAVGSDGYLHLCGKVATDRLTNTIAELWKLARERIPKFDSDG